MKKNLRLLVVAALGAAASVAFTSCAYDPYYSSTTVGGSYSSGYGQGYGYGGSSFNTSVFVSTGDSRWGYDPYTYSYYDYTRRSYYDPYLNGYYPIGYRPPVVYGVPHPYGWRPGSSYCPPPRYVRNVTVVNYRNRETAYRGTSYGWAKQVRQQGGGNVRDERPRTQYQNKYSESSGSRSSSRESSYRESSSSRQKQMINQREESSRYSAPSSSRTKEQSRKQISTPEKRYNAPVSTYTQEPSKKERAARTQSRESQRPQLGSPGSSSRAPSAPGRTREESPRSSGNSRDKGDDKRIQGYR